MSNAILEGLNPEQLEAVTLPLHSAEGEALCAIVLAGAGSGKTRVLTTRIAWLIQTGQVSPHGVLAVTFTNKAAREMLTRISAMLPINTRGMWVGTFHGLCNRMLRAHWQEAALPQQFQILDSQDQLAVVKRLLKGLNADDQRFPPREVQWFINGQKDGGLRARHVTPYDEFTRRCAEFYAAYEEQCQREGVADFAELLLRSHELLERNQPLREHYQARFRHILVDEFQDTSPLQYRWLKLLAGGRNAVFAVGDDDQSIYGFRGATVRNMEDFRRDFPAHRLVKLEQNYRSHGNILDAANALIRNNRGRLGKNLWTTDDRGEPLRVYEAATDIEEAAFVVDEARTLHAEGVALTDIAVLYRSNAQSRVLEHALFSAGLPYRVYGGLRFFERQEIKHALAYLRLAASPDDDNALLRVVNVPARGIGARSVEQLQEDARAAGGSLWQAVLKRSAVSGQRSAEGGKGVSGFVALIESLRAGVAGLPLPEAVEHVVAKSGLIEMYRAEREGADRIENLGELVTAATGFVLEADDDSLVAFLSHAALEAGEHQAAGGADALQLMTAHSAKGLEFHSVFVTGLEEALFPHENSVNAGDGLEEERRLMYVALTRARRRLYLSHARCRMLHGQTRYNVASRFLQEVPEGLLRWVGPGKAGFRIQDRGSSFRDQGARFK
ncbi:MAG TPA: UvrD-helicase domain-containing protein, partial [Burkholderiales bacterium]